MKDRVETLARRLDEAMRTRVQIAPLSESDGVTDVETAYAIQNAWTALRTARGERIVGHKIGLTSEAIRKQLNVDQPDSGALWRTTQYEAKDGAVEIPAADFLQPRLEGEVAFLIGKKVSRPPGQPISAEDVLAATDACALGVEIVASRIADWKITLADTIADNASYGGFTLGPWDRKMLEHELGVLAMTITQNDTLAAEGAGAAALGHPAKSVAWLANRLREFGVSLEPGDIVISGGITKMLPVTAGDQFILTLTSQPSLVVKFV